MINWLHRKFETNNANFDFADYPREVALKRYTWSHYNNSNLAEVIHENEAVRWSIMRFNKGRETEMDGQRNLKGRNEERETGRSDQK